MLKSIQDLGKSLTRQQQQLVKGGNIGGLPCNSHQDCWNASPYLGPGDVSCRTHFFSGDRKVCVFN